MKEFVEELICRLKTKKESVELVNLDYAEGLKDAYEIAIEIVNQLAEEHNDGWIPCSEKLPENDDDVLCWYEYRIMQGTHEGEMNRKCEIGYYNKYFKRWGGEVSCGRDCKVIAWRPLPEPYKEDEEE